MSALCCCCRLVAVAFFAPLLLPVAAALASNSDLTSLWSMSAWTLFPIVLLSSPQMKISPLNLQRIVAVPGAEPLIYADCGSGHLNAEQKARFLSDAVRAVAAKDKNRKRTLADSGNANICFWRKADIAER